jgi:8-oxo-dGTP diphosphatase
MERDGNGWVECSLGHRHWGKYGAAGLLLHTVDPDGTLRVLLQHRADWCHHGGTWGLLGGARDSHEMVEQAALREASEEAALPVENVRVRHVFVDDHGGWSYTTVYGDCTDRLATTPNEESAELEWVASSEVSALALHPGFGHTWEQVRLPLATVIVDAANVVGSRPDGWWRDRAGATTRLANSLGTLRSTTVNSSFGRAIVGDVFVVVEGAARDAEIPEPLVSVRAKGSGDDAFVAVVNDLKSDNGNGDKDDGDAVVIGVTGDRELRGRAREAGADTLEGATWLLQLLD